MSTNEDFFVPTRPQAEFSVNQSPHVLKHSALRGIYCISSYSCWTYTLKRVINWLEYKEIIMHETKVIEGAVS